MLGSTIEIVQAPRGLTPKWGRGRCYLFGVILAGTLPHGRAVGADAGVSQVAASPVYFGRPIKEEDLTNRSLPDLALMRNTIYAHSGRRFRSFELQELFGRQPWYVPKPPSQVKVTPLDISNLRAIVARERQLRRPAIAPLCPGLSGKTWKLDITQQAQLQNVEGGLDWPPDGAYGKTGDCQRTVRVTCGPDLDGDGAPEFIVDAQWWLLIDGQKRCAPEIDTNSRWQITHLFLATRKEGRWIGLAPLAWASEEYPEAVISDAYFVGPPAGQAAVYVSEINYSPDEGTQSTTFRTFEFQKGKLREVARGVEPDGSQRR
jgi:hypothetical protein